MKKIWREKKSKLLSSTFKKKRPLQAFSDELIEEDEFIVESILDKRVVKKVNLST
jgi:hypothetical protein